MISRDDVIEDCICEVCPTYIEDDTPIGYCHPDIGMSRVITDEHACICGNCRVYRTMDLHHSFYCARGSEPEQVRSKS